MKKKTIILLGITITIVLISILVFVPEMISKANRKPEIVTVSTLEKIISTSELSTFQAVYNGIAEVMNEKKPDELDYYVSYEATVYAGFDLESVKLSLDEETKKINLTIPKIEVIDVNVDIASLDYIFLNNKANTSTVSAQAYKACKADAINESKEQTAILDLAKQNAENIMKALINPFISQLDSEYKLEITFGGVL